MASSKSQKKSAVLDFESLSNLERLIFSQAVHHFGTHAWGPISKLLNGHPLLSRPKNFFDPVVCSTIYNFLLNSTGLESSEADAHPRSTTNLKLATNFYLARTSELKRLIAAEEAKFRAVVTEIDEIRAGEWDNRIRAQLSGGNPIDELPEPSPAEPDFQPPQVLAEEITQEEGTPQPEDMILEPESSPEAPDNQTEVEQETSAAEAHDDPQQEPVHLGLPTPNTAEDISEFQDIEDVSEPPSSKIPTESQEIEVNQLSVPEEVKIRDKLVDDTFEHNSPPVEAEEIIIEEPEVVPTEAQVHSPVPPEEDIAMAPAQAEPIQPSAPPEPEPEPEPESAPTPSEPPTRLEGKRKVSDTDGSIFDTQRESKRPREESEVADEEDVGTSQRPDTPHSPLSPAIPGPSTVSKSRRRGQAQSEAQVVSKKFQNVIGMLHSTISQHRYGNIFHNPIKKSEAPDYHDIVKRPMDLKTIKARVKDGLTSNSLEFQRDVYLMFANAMMYNRPGSEIYNMAEEMMLESEVQINTFRQTEGFHRG